jgi:2-C-methyl-D-erythritol 4-phosphate cytidylyltransferase/2-C-methyl-D-erythritol 2,4-cyclodiphosphate synthase
MHVSAIIAAGGRGTRLGGDRLKQLLPLGGRSILERSVAAFVDHPLVDEVIVALPQSLFDDPPPYLRPAHGFPRGRSGDGPSSVPAPSPAVSPSADRTAPSVGAPAARADPPLKPLRLVAGGERRQDSVANAFRAAAMASDVIVIHDAARPFASADLIARTIAAAAESGAAVAAVPARDTVKRVGPGRVRSDAEAERFVRETLDRSSIYLAQTPQAFRRDVLRDALALGGDATDEGALAEQAGHAVRIVEGETTNIKITTPDDLRIAEGIAAMKPARTGRAGIGYDVHRLVEGRALILGGVTIPFDRGLIGHSDADAVCHAITEAILGAAAAGDIGSHFPDADPRWKNASSLDLLRRATAIVREQGLEVGNIDVSVIAERPKLLPHLPAMRANVAAAVGLPPDRVSIKGKTNDGLGEIGRGEAIAAHAIALLRLGTTD